MSTQGLDESRRTKWILIANRGEAKILQGNWNLSQITMLQDIPHPDGRKQNHDIDAADRGTRFSSVAGRGNASTHGGGHASQQQKHGLDRHEEAIEHVANVFAREICHILHSGRTQGKFEELILVADPHFLGRIRTFLDKETLNLVSHGISQNWINLPDAEMHEKLRELARKVAA